MIVSTAFLSPRSRMPGADSGLAGLFSGLMGLGEDEASPCPSYAPYRNSSGGCSNVPESFADATVSEIQAAGAGWNPAGVLTVQEPAGSGSGAGSGIYDQFTPGGQAAATGAVLERSMAEAEAKARAAEAQGRALGLNVRCSTYQNTSPSSLHPTLFGTDCTVNGASGNDADLLMAPGGWRIAAVEAARVAGTPVQHIQLSTQAPPRYDFLNPNIPDTLTTVNARENVRPNPNAVPAQTPAAAPQTRTQVTAAPVIQPPASGNALERALTTLPSAGAATQNLLDSARAALDSGAGAAAAATGLSTTTILIGGAAVLAFFFLRGRR